jgi:hypothetical protein
MRLVARLSGISILVCASLISVQQFSAEQASAAEPANLPWSFYVTVPYGSSGASAMDTLGCNEAGYDNAEHLPSVVILDFGALSVSGTGDQLEINNVNTLTPPEVETLAEWFLNGYDGCSPTEYVDLAIGANNSIELGVAKGQDFGLTVKSVQTWANTYSGGHAEILGANDIEAWNANAAPVYANSWYTGYSEEGAPVYLDYGSANGCPSPENPTNSCTGGWTQASYYNVAWGFALATSTPEIYYPPNNGDQAGQWDYISNVGGGMDPLGPLTENASGTNSASAAWSQMAGFFPNMYAQLFVYGDG